MADYRAIMGVSEAVIHLLESSYDPDVFDTPLDFQVFTSNDFTDQKISAGVSLFVYRVFAHGAHRSPAGRMGTDGRRLQSTLPLEIHFLLTVWGGHASLQHSLAGWVMRALEDTPTLPAAALNAVVPGVFRDEESVDVCLSELRTEDLFRIWDVLGKDVYQLSIAYLARVINIESTRRLPADAGLVQDRTTRAGFFTT